MRAALLRAGLLRWRLLLEEIQAREQLIQQGLQARERRVSTSNCY